MPFKKGQSGNPKGKPVGAKGKKTAQWEALSESITGIQSEHFNNYINDLWNGSKEDKESAAELFLKTVEYFKPKQARQETVHSGDISVNKIIFEDAEDSKD